MPGKRKTSPKRIKRKTSPKRVKRKTSPKRVKRKTSPKRIKRKTSPKRKRRMNGIGDYFRRRAGREVRTDDPGMVDIDWPEEMEAGPGRPSRQDSAGPGRPRAREYSNLSEDRLGTRLLTLLESVETCEDLMSLQQTSSEMRQFIMKNLPVIYRRLKEKDPMLPDLVFTDDIRSNYRLFVNTCLDRERQAAMRGDYGYILAEYGRRGHGYYYELSPEERKAIRRTEEALIYIGFRRDYILSDELESIPMGYLTKDQVKFLKLLHDYIAFLGTRYQLVTIIAKQQIGPVIVNRYTSGQITEDQTMDLLLQYIREIRNGDKADPTTDLGLWSDGRMNVENYVDRLYRKVGIRM